MDEMQTLHQRRPCHAKASIIERQQLATETPVYILKDAAGCRYMRLSEEGLFLWQQIDGTRTIRDLCATYVVRFGRLAPQEVLRALARLIEAEFVTFETGEPNVQMPPRARPGTLEHLSSLCIRYAYLPDMDSRMTALYRHLRLLYTPFAQAVMLVIAFLGAAVFAWHWATGAVAPVNSLPRATLVWIASLAVHVVVHEAAHALTCKHFGRAVHRIGVGWYYFAPVAFVDTSDMWPAARWPRILVSAAGPYSNLVLAGIAALAALLLAALPPAALPPAANGVRDMLWSFGMIGYVLAAVNMNPLLELDGYYVLMDLLEIPNLRSRALACLGAILHGRPRREPQVGGLVVWFGAASLVYGFAMGLGVLLASGAWIGNIAGAWLPQPCAHAAGWALAGTMSLLILHRLLDGLRPTQGG